VSRFLRVQLRSFFIPVVAALLLASCAELPFSQAESGVEFELRGRIAVRYRDEAASGNIGWRHAAASDEVLITSSLGQGVARIVREAGQVTLTTQDGREHRAADAESLTEQVLGFRVPLAGLADWVRGKPAPGAARERRDAAGRLVELDQAGWNIAYEAWSEDGSRPTRMKLAYPGMELRLAIAEWRGDR
jgi:outer membrane lipoprotein LolB